MSDETLKRGATCPHLGCSLGYKHDGPCVPAVSDKLTPDDYALIPVRCPAMFFSDPCLLADGHVGPHYYFCPPSRTETPCDACNGSGCIECDGTGVWHRRSPGIRPPAVASAAGMTEERLAEIRADVERHGPNSIQVAHHAAELLAEVTRLRSPGSDTAPESDVGVICRMCGHTVAGVEAAERVRFVTCRECGPGSDTALRTAAAWLLDEVERGDQTGIDHAMADLRATLGGSPSHE